MIAADQMPAPPDSRMLASGTGRRSLPGPKVLLALAVAWSAALGAGHATAQQPPRHQFHGASSAPGVAAFHRLLRGPAQVGYYQPVQIMAPEGSQVWLWNGDGFQSTHNRRPIVAMQVGHVYRVKVTHIPGQPGLELFPSLEVLHRLFPPPGIDQVIPIQVLLDLDDLRLAADGNLVTRVVYLEDPDTAIPHRQHPGDQQWFDVHALEDPLHVADRLGRAMVIVRVGSRVPDAVDLHTFDFGSPPVGLLSPPEPAEPPEPMDNGRR